MVKARDIWALAAVLCIGGLIFRCGESSTKPPASEEVYRGSINSATIPLNDGGSLVFNPLSIEFAPKRTDSTFEIRGRNSAGKVICSSKGDFTNDESYFHLLPDSCFLEDGKPAPWELASLCGRNINLTVGGGGDSLSTSLLEMGSILLLSGVDLYKAMSQFKPGVWDSLILVQVVLLRQR